MKTDVAANPAQPRPRRRWHQFSLRTLLILVTLAGCGFAWLRWQFKIAQVRKAVRAEMDRRGTYYVTLDGTRRKGETPVTDVPLVRRWLGDEAIVVVGFNSGDTPSPYADRVKSAFPETTISDPRFPEPMPPPAPAAP